MIGHGHPGLATAAGTHDVKEGKDHCRDESDPKTQSCQPFDAHIH